MEGFKVFLQIGLLTLINLQFYCQGSQESSLYDSRPHEGLQMKDSIINNKLFSLNLSQHLLTNTILTILSFFNALRLQKVVLTLFIILQYFCPTCFVVYKYYLFRDHFPSLIKVGEVIPKVTLPVLDEWLPCHVMTLSVSFPIFIKQGKWHLLYISQKVLIIIITMSLYSDFNPY